MTSSPFIAIDGKHYLWRDILELHREQLAACANLICQFAEYS
jgi:hypothetical protein